MSIDRIERDPKFIFPVKKREPSSLPRQAIA